MEALTTQSIINTFKKIKPKKTLHPTTIALVQSILSPYAEEADQLEPVSKGGVGSWLKNTFQFINDYQSKVITDKIDRIENSANVIITEILEYILDIGTIPATDYKDHVVLPWDIIETISADGQYKDTFNLEWIDKLPVEIKVDGETVTHMLSLDFTCGLLLFSIAAKVNFNITILGVPFGKDYFTTTEGKRNRFEISDGELLDYTIVVSNVEYQFMNLEFVQGFMTGADWLSVDHHKYWSNFINYQKDLNYNGSRIVVKAIRMTF